MQIREANENDIPGILNVLKASLGETSSKKTEEVWRYKHIDNPFGESLVLVAEEAGIIVGVRAFMRWQWQKGEKVFSAFRAVDTATHPEHQGKGIFKKLTLKALELGKQRGDHFVFNTPNNQSKPGYLKMGWRELGKVKTTLVPVNPLYWNNKRRFEAYVGPEKKISSELLLQWNKDLEIENHIFTPKSSDYLDWRYINNPLQQYKLEVNENVFIAGYIKDRGKVKELRISELIFYSDISKILVRNTIREWAKESGANFISFGSSFHNELFKTGIAGNFGPVLTFKPLNLDQPGFTNLNSWAYSLGDLELF